MQIDGGRFFDRSQLAAALRRQAQETPQSLILIRGDEAANEPSMVNALAVAYESGFKFAMMTGERTECERDMIQTILTSDLHPWIIITETGVHFEIDGQDVVDPSLWKARQRLLNCPNWQGNDFYDLGNIDRGERLPATRLRRTN